MVHCIGFPAKQDIIQGLSYIYQALPGFMAFIIYLIYQDCLTYISANSERMIAALGTWAHHGPAMGPPIAWASWYVHIYICNMYIYITCVYIYMYMCMIVYVYIYNIHIITHQWSVYLRKFVGSIITVYSNYLWIPSNKSNSTPAQARSTKVFWTLRGTTRATYQPPGWNTNPCHIVIS